MFGYPTGVGALLARRDALPRLRRPWFAGGTIHVASVQADQFRRADGAAAFEDGTPDFLAMPAIEFGLDLLETVGMNVVHARVRTLTAWLIDELLGLRHGNGTRAVRLYGPASTDHRGGTVAFNLATPDGSPIDHDVVHQRAALERISLRTGCFCNPGAGEVAFDLSRGEIAGCLARSPERMTHEDFRHCIDPRRPAPSACRSGWRAISTMCGGSSGSCKASCLCKQPILRGPTAQHSRAPSLGPQHDPHRQRRRLSDGPT